MTECDHCGVRFEISARFEVIAPRFSDGTYTAVLWFCPTCGPQQGGIKPDAWCPDAGMHTGPVCHFCGTEPEVCACGDEEWGGCGKATCHEQYETERNAT